jgi:hypothetical protein
MRNSANDNGIYNYHTFNREQWKKAVTTATNFRNAQKVENFLINYEDTSVWSSFLLEKYT